MEVLILICNNMKKFVVILSGGGEGDFFEYNIVVEANDIFSVQYMLLESKGLSNDNHMEYNFDDYQIYGLDEWVSKNIIKLNDLIKTRG